MNKTVFLKRTALPAMLAVAMLALWRVPEPVIETEADVRMTLPDRIGEWQGHAVLFCQNPDCMRGVLWNPGDETTCPTCESELHIKSYAENTVLPADTEIVRKRYAHPRGPTLLLTIVLSGADRASIHRPERCLTAQGATITSRRIVRIEDDAGSAFSMTCFDTQQTRGHGQAVPGVFCYWFAGQNRETPFHWERMAWTGMARLFQGRVTRWAYISISGESDAAATRHDEYIVPFARKARAALLAKGNPPPSRQ